MQNGDGTVDESEFVAYFYKQMGDLAEEIFSAVGRCRRLEEKHLDGLSFKNSLVGKNQDNSKRPIYWHSPRPRPQSTGDLANTTVRLGDFKLLDFYKEGRVELYNIKKDQGETINLADKMPKKKIKK